MLRSSKVLAVLAAALVVAACGGGGGGADAPAPGGGGGDGGGGGGGGGGGNPVDASAPLALNSGNYTTAASLALAFAELPLLTAQLAVQSARRWDRAGFPLTGSEACPNGGLQSFRLVDRDGNGVVSTGDGVTVDFGDCAVPVLAAVLTGRLSVELTTVGEGAARRIAGRFEVPQGSTLGQIGNPAAGVLGYAASFGFSAETTASRHTMSVRSDAADSLRISGRDSRGATVVETIHSLDLTRTERYDEARAQTQIALTYDSQIAGGRVVLSSPEPLLSYLNTFPEAGRLLVSGAGTTRAHVRTNFIASNPYATVVLDANGDGAGEAEALFAWEDLSSGFLWADTRRAPRYALYTERAYPAVPYRTTDFGWSIVNALTIAVGDTVWLQFTRVPTDLPALSARFRDLGPVTGYETSSTNVAGNVTVIGAMFSVRPATQLKHGRRYSLELSTDGGATWGAAVNVRDALGNRTEVGPFGIFFFSTNDNLRGSIAASGALLDRADRVVTLDASASVSTGRPIVRHAWRQVGGTALRIESPDAPTTRVSWGSSEPTGLERITIELTVTDAAGETDTVRFELHALSLGGVRSLLYVRSTAPTEYVGRGTSFAASEVHGPFSFEGSQAGTVRLFYRETDVSAFWHLTLSSGDGTPLRVGVYENAVDEFFPQPGRPILSLSGGVGGRCATVYGRFTVHEVVADGNGGFATLAVDFEQRCDSTTAPPLFGSVRLNSSVPLPR